MSSVVDSSKVLTKHTFDLIEHPALQHRQCLRELVKLSLQTPDARLILFSDSIAFFSQRDNFSPQAGKLVRFRHFTAHIIGSVQQGEGSGHIAGSG